MIPRSRAPDSAKPRVLFTHVASRPSTASERLDSPENERLNNSAEDANEVMHRAVEARLHHMQFERVFCKASHKRDDLYAYFIKRHQIAMGLIPDPKKVREERQLGNPGGTTDYEESSESDISNFSLEIEMLNRMHVDKNSNM